MRIRDPLFSRRPAELDFNIITGTFDDFDWSNPLICHGKGGGGSSGGTTTSTSQPPQQVLDAYQTAINAAQSAASAPLQQYSGATVAGFTPDQLSAFGTVDSAQGAAQPFIQNAQNLIQQGTQPLWSGVAPVNQSTISQYQSPYTQQVYNAQVAQEQNTDAQQQQALKGNAISSGAWGGDRAGVASAVLSGQQDLANNTTNANILNQGYNTALTEANTEQQAQLGANEANSYLNQQGAFGEANLGNEALGTQLTGAAAQAASGAAQQQLGQDLLNVPYQQFLQQQAYPFQTAQYFGNVAEGIGSNEGGTSTTTQPAPNSSKGKNRGGRIPYKRGGPVRLATGGVGIDAGIPDQSISYIPATTSQSRGGEGPPKPPVIPGQKGTQGLSLQDLMTIGKGLNQMLGKSGSGATSLTGANQGQGVPPTDEFGTESGGVQGESNPLDIFGDGGDESALEGSSDAFGDSAGDGAGDFFADDSSDLFDFFKRGGGVRGAFGTGGKVRPKGYDSGGSIKHDNTWLSTIGDWAGTIVGSIFGGPAGGYVGGKAGADAGGTLGDVFGGNWDGVGSDIKAGPIGDDPIFADVVGDNSPGQGNSPQLGGNFSNTSKFGINDDPGNGQNSNFFKNRGGRIARKGYDDGGQVGGQTPLQAGQTTQNPQQQTQTSSYQNMTPEQLQMMVLRLPAGSQQQRQATAVLQQKRMLPNVGAAPQGGMGTQTGAPAQAGMARGGFAGGGIAPPPDPMAIQQAMDDQNSAGPDPYGYSSALGISLPAPAPPPMSAMSAPDPTGAKSPVPQVAASDLAPPSGGMGSGAGAPPPPPPADSSQSDDAGMKDRSAALQQLVAMNDKGGGDDSSSSDSSDSDDDAKPDPDSSSSPHATRSEPNPWLSLAVGAFAGAAGTSPYRMQNQAAGVLAGLKNYGDQVKESDSVNQAADKLMAEAQQHRDAIKVEQEQRDETNRHNQVIEQQGNYEPIKDMFGNVTGMLDKKSGTVKPISGSAAGAGSTVGADGKPPNIMNIYQPPVGDDGKPLTGDAYLSTIPPQVSAQAQDYISGNLPPPTGFATKPAMLAAYHAAQNADPSFKQYAGTRNATITDFVKGPQTAKTVQAQNVAMEHLSTLNDAVDALDNGNVPAFNAATNALAKQTGSPAPTNFELGKTFVSDELAKAVMGTTGAAVDRDNIAKNLNMGSSNDQAKGFINTAGQYMAGQAHGLEQRYKAGTGLDNYRDRFQTPRAKALLDQYYPADGSSPAGAGGASNAPPAGAIQMLKKDPTLAPMFKQKYGVDPSQYLGAQ